MVCTSVSGFIIGVVQMFKCQWLVCFILEKAFLFSASSKIMRCLKKMLNMLSNTEGMTNCINVYITKFDLKFIKVDTNGSP